MCSRSVLTCIISATFAASVATANNDGVEATKINQTTLNASELAASVMTEPPTEGWRLVVSPTLWLPPVDGNLQGGGLTTEFEASQSERIDRFHASGELFLEFTNGRWTFVLQPQYSDLEIDGRVGTPLGELPLAIRTESLVIEYWVGRRFGESVNWFEVLVGGRYLDLKTETASILGQQKADYEWHDPMVGARGHYNLGGAWSLESLVTASGFDAYDNASELTWEARASLNFQPSQRWAVKVGYRHFDTEFTENENDPDETRLHYNLSGPFLAFSMRLR